MSTILLCQTILCLASPSVVPVIGHQNKVSSRKTVTSSSRATTVIPAANILDHLIMVNPWVRYSQSDKNGNIVVDGSGYNNRPIGVVGNRRPKPGNSHKRPLPLKIFGEGTEHRFGPILEFIVQRIQTQFSNYIHEDLSRPALYSSGLPNEDDPVNVNGDSIEVSNQESTVIPTVVESDEYEGSGGWLTVNK